MDFKFISLEFCWQYMSHPFTQFSSMLILYSFDTHFSFIMKISILNIFSIINYVATLLSINRRHSLLIFYSFYKVNFLQDAKTYSQIPRATDHLEKCSMAYSNPCKICTVHKGGIFRKCPNLLASATYIYTSILLPIHEKIALQRHPATIYAHLIELDKLISNICITMFKNAHQRHQWRKTK